MEHTFKELKHMKVDQLREIAAATGEDGIKGYTQLNKEHLLEAICKALNIDMHVHHEVVGIDKNKIKAKIKALKKERDEAIGAKDKDKLRKTRRKIRNLKKRLRQFTV